MSTPPPSESNATPKAADAAPRSMELGGIRGLIGIGVVAVVAVLFTMYWGDDTQSQAVPKPAKAEVAASTVLVPGADSQGSVPSSAGGGGAQAGGAAADEHAPVGQSGASEDSAAPVADGQTQEDGTDENEVVVLDPDSPTEASQENGTPEVQDSSKRGSPDTWTPSANTGKRPDEDGTAAELLAAAHKAYERGEMSTAYRLANKSARKEPKEAAYELKALSACRMSNTRAAKSATRRLTSSRRRAVRKQCRSHGVRLGIL